MGLLVFITCVNVVISYVQKDFFDSLADRHAKEFYAAGVWYLCGLGIATILAAFYRYTEERLALVWREWLTATLLHKYLASRNYYRLRSLKEVDNPDQRISEDVRNFTATSLSLFLILLNSSITLFAFLGVLAAISLKLVVTLFVYTVVGTYGTMKIGKKLVRIHNRQYAREATFRYGLVRVRDNAESVAFYRGERREKLDLGRRFRDLLRNNGYLITWNRNLSFFTTGYNNLALVLPVFVIAPLCLDGTVKIGTVTQAAGAFAQVLASSSILITQFERLSAYVAGASRVEALWDEVQSDPDAEETQIDVEEGAKLVLSKLTIRPPQSTRELVRELEMKLKPGTGLLIMGESGSGKSSILRTIAGLWNSGSGAIKRPNHREMMFLPQKPYMPPGSLRSQLLYPYRERHEMDSRLAAVLKKVNLSNIFKRVDGNLDASIDWTNVLSLGEQQRVSFARLLIAQPSVAFLDEATSALDEDNENRLYELLRKEKLTFVSVGHRSTLANYHDQILELDGKGGWKIFSAEQGRQT